MRCRLLAAVAALCFATGASPCAARGRLPRPSAASFLAAAPIAPNGLLIHDAGRMRTLELAPLRLRLSIPF